jgi:hypothetical protein
VTRARALLLALAAAFLTAPALALPLTDVSQVYMALQAKRYEDIEAFYAKVRKERRREPDGQFLFETFYWNLPWHSTDDPKDADYWPKVDAATAAWVAHSPNSHLALMNRAFVLARRAEHLQAINGSWKEVDRFAAEAKRMVLASKKLGASDANWHATRLRVASVEGVPRADVLDLIHAAAEADPYPLRIWQEAAIALSPTGQPAEDLIWLMRLAVQRTSAKEGTTMYARVLASAYWMYPELTARPFAVGLNWNAAHESLTELKQRYPAAYDPNLHGALACIAHDRTATAASLAQAAKAPRSDVWERWGGKSHFARCQEWATQAPVRART